MRCCMAIRNPPSVGRGSAYPSPAAARRRSRFPRISRRRRHPTAAHLRWIPGSDERGFRKAATTAAARWQAHLRIEHQIAGHGHAYEAISEDARLAVLKGHEAVWLRLHETTDQLTPRKPLVQRCHKTTSGIT
eukprot:scaffold480_cov257-Pinguiococcus_pyrenoidosus.AAC.11